MPPSQRRGSRERLRDLDGALKSICNVVAVVQIHFEARRDEFACLLVLVALNEWYSTSVFEQRVAVIVHERHESLL